MLFTTMILAVSFVLATFMAIAGSDERLVDSSKVAATAGTKESKETSRQSANERPMRSVVPSWRNVQVAVSRSSKALPLW